MPVNRHWPAVDVRTLQEDPDVFTLQVRLSDIFGDNGMISVIVCRSVDRNWEIDTWLMSCRVLKRRVEEAVLAEIIRRARQAGVRALIGRYIPTDRNAIVRQHYRGLGFDFVSENANEKRSRVKSPRDLLPPSSFDLDSVTPSLSTSKFKSNAC